MSDGDLAIDHIQELRAYVMRGSPVLLSPEAAKHVLSIIERDGMSGANTTPIRVWWFDDAPQELRDLSPHGGDEDWLGEFPPWCSDFAPLWSHAGSAFGVCDVSEHAHPTKPGWTVRIGAHA